jgi:hypothetical protein
MRDYADSLHSFIIANIELEASEVTVPSVKPVFADAASPWSKQKSETAFEHEEMCEPRNKL